MRGEGRRGRRAGSRDKGRRLRGPRCPRGVGARGAEDRAEADGRAAAQKGRQGADGAAAGVGALGCGVRWEPGLGKEQGSREGGRREREGRGGRCRGGVGGGRRCGAGSGAGRVPYRAHPAERGRTERVSGRGRGGGPEGPPDSRRGLGRVCRTPFSAAVCVCLCVRVTVCASAGPALAVRVWGKGPQVHTQGVGGLGPTRRAEVARQPPPECMATPQTTRVLPTSPRDGERNMQMSPL